MIPFGPVPSRRLGRSLGVNHIPPKHCTYACVYCQVGATSHRGLEPRRFYGAARIVQEVTEHVEKLGPRDEGIDFIAFVPDGEPTLDVDLGDAIDGLRSLHVPIAVITNGTLLGREDVRARLARADWVSVKVDAAVESVWRRVNRPNPRLELDALLTHARTFRESFDGTFVTETMLIGGVNDDVRTLHETARAVARLDPMIAHVSVPTRPPSVSAVGPPDATALLRAKAIFREHIEHVAMLTDQEGSCFGATGDVASDVLDTVAVHPLREDQILALLRREHADRSVLERLVEARRLERVSYRGQTFYVRPPPGRR